MSELEDLVPPLLDLCRDAGDVICEHYHAPGADDFQAKDDDSPLTRADLASDRLLHAGLAALDPRLPVLSEETADKVGRERLDWARYWLVDPLDGTREFLARTGEFTVNIALIDDHRPQLGLLYLPLSRRAYVGIPGSGARCYSAGAGGDWVATPLGTRDVPADGPLVVLASRRHRGPRLERCLAWLESAAGEVRRSNAGSALKFCRLAAGEADCYPRFAPCCEWDTAAGQALLEAAGGALLGLDGRPLRYNRGDSLYSPHFLALAQPGHDLWQQLLVELASPEAAD